MDLFGIKKRKELNNTVGKLWKRVWLLENPPLYKVGDIVTSHSKKYEVVACYLMAKRHDGQIIFWREYNVRDKKKNVFMVDESWVLKEGIDKVIYYSRHGGRQLKPWDI